MIAPPNYKVPQLGKEKVSEEAAGYMELEGAEKDGECQIVHAENGVSLEKGCCNLYKPDPGADEFKCGECKYRLEDK
jgi:hypothetical protein